MIFRLLLNYNKKEKIIKHMLQGKIISKNIKNEQINPLKTSNINQQAHFLIINFQNIIFIDLLISIKYSNQRSNTKFQIFIYYWINDLKHSFKHILTWLTQRHNIKVNIQNSVLLILNKIFKEQQFILFMSKYQLNSLIQQITHSKQFFIEVQRCVENINNNPTQGNQLPTFSFEKAAKYPWSIVEGNMPIQGQKMVEEITDLIASIIDNTLHQILSREFLNISNQILTIREEMTEFSKNQEERSKKYKEQFDKQFENLRKKMILQQNSNGLRQKQFVRTRASGLNSSSSSAMHTQSKSQMKGDLEILRKEIENLKKQISKSQIMHTVHDKQIYLEEQFKNDITDLKVKVEAIKQKSERGLKEITVKLTQQNNKQYLSGEVKRAIKSYFKIYMEEINFCKENISKIQNSLGKMDKGLQDYISNQLKSVWVILGNVKRRVEEIEQKSNLHNQSFMID